MFDFDGESPTYMTLGNVGAPRPETRTDCNRLPSEDRAAHTIDRFLLL
jgi:hypothetical protein